MSRGARMALLAVIVAALALVLVGCGDDGEDPPAAAGTTTAATTTTAPAEIPTITVVGGVPQGGPIRIAGRPGDTLRFAVVSDTADELHVHGYDLLQPLEPGVRAEVEIAAGAEGIFEVELHGSGELVARLVVEP